eukprot:jgi/Phyca11/118136/e_gw1.35.402.1
MGWYRRFNGKFHDLSSRASQSVSKIRNNVTELEVATLFSSLAKVIVEENMDESRVFNTFESSRKTTRVIALKGSKNVWHTDPTTSFHLSIVACGSASGFIVPPLFILPGACGDRTLEAMQYSWSSSDNYDKGIYDSHAIQKMDCFLFALLVPTPVKRPLLLVMDGCSPHIATEIVETADWMQIRLVCLPANGTHLLQPLGAAVFSSFKNTLQDLIDAIIRANGINTTVAPP